MKSLAEARIKRTREVELASQGMSYDETATAVGYSHRGSAHRAVFKALAEHEVEEVELLRAMEMGRLKRCPCPAQYDDRGTQKTCPKRHGTGWYSVDVGNDPAPACAALSGRAGSPRSERRRAL